MAQKGDKATIRGKQFELTTVGQTGVDRFVEVKTPQEHRFYVPVELWDAATMDGKLLDGPAQRMENIVRSFGPSLPGPEKVEERTSFMEELRALINRHSAENGSDTPDFLLAAYLYDCLVAFDRTVRDRERWYGRRKKPIAFQRPHMQQRGTVRGAWEESGFSPRQVGMPDEEE